MKRSEDIELLLRLSESLDIKETLFKQRIYNVLLSELKLNDVKSNKTKYDELLASIIIKEVGDYFLMENGYNKINSRKRKYTLPKFISTWFISINTKLIYTDISDMFTYRDHAMVNHAKKTINNLLENDINLRNDIENIAMKLKLNY